ncbi:structral protein [Synechococcus phage S-RSM4]|uniref:Structral protein n=1 Tax=Synechococcus phage S-RSM4 TaxID=555387 RepID=C7BV05_9CAUD|nr:virion structural protein [Synechococcus phage S-RSM4]CAR63234.1 structral protein [Synechococcus phage S-RSM4]
MPVSFNSPPRNFFLLGSSGEDIITNFFSTVDKSASLDGVYLPDEIRYSDVDQKYIIAGSAENSNSESFGWFEKRDYNGTTSTEDWNVRVQSTQSGSETTLRAMELDDNVLYVVGKTADIPWVAKYTDAGIQQWQSTTNTADVEYTGIAFDSNSNVYACGNTPVSGEAQAFVEKFDVSGNPGWGKSAFMLGRDVVLNKISANSRGEVVAAGYLEDDSATKGYIIKLDTATGEVLWDRTIKSQETIISGVYKSVLCEDVFIDNKDQIYVVGRVFAAGFSRGFIIKYSPEGNIIWQKETSDGDHYEYYNVKSDGDVEQTIVFGRHIDSGGDEYGVLTKYSKNGDIVFRRHLSSSYNASGNFGRTGNGGAVNLDADPSFYYLLYIDDAIDGLNGTPASYTFGKVSTSGNGFGNFSYNDGTGETVFYDVSSNTDRIGRLSDGSVRNDTSDLITYPFNANNLLFDDLATQVSNKKRQMDGPDSFEYSGSPAIRVADFQELNLLGDVYSGSGNWLDQSGKGNDGVVNGATHNAAGYWEFDGVDDRIVISRDDFTTALNIGFSIETWFRVDTTPSLPTSRGYIWDQTPSTNGASFRIAQDLRLTTFAYPSGGGGVILIATPVAYGGVVTGKWYHAVTVIDTNSITLYVDGEYQGLATGTMSAVASSGNTDFFIGSNAEVDEFFDGQIGEFRIYPRALTAAQVFQNYNATKSKYINEAPDTAPKIGPGIVYDSNLLLNYDFGNRACFDFKHNYINYNTKQLPITGVQDNNDTVDGYTVTRGGIISNTEVAPDGSRTAVLFREADGIEGSARIFTAGWRQPDFDGQVHYFSTYVKKAGSRYVYVAMYQSDDGNDYDGVKFDFDTETLIDADPSANWDRGFTNVGNGWYRIWIGFPINIGTSIYVTVGSDDNGTLEGLTTNLVTRNIDAFYTWGWQVTKDALTDTYINSGTVYSSGKLDPPTTVKNLSSSSYTGTFDAEIVGQSPEFNSNGYMVFGSNETIRFGSLVDLGFPSGSQSHTLTVEFWVQSNTEASHIFAGIQGPDTERFYLARRGGTWDFGWGNFGWDNGYTGGTSASDRATVSTNTWTHYCISAQSGVATLYINGSRTVEKTDTTVNFGSGDWPIGGWFNPANTYNASYGSPNSIAECRIYNRALSSTEVSQNFNATRSKYGV